MMLKIDLTDDPIPKVINLSGLLFDNAKGGPYKYGNPVLFNAACINAMKAGRL